MSGPQKDNSTFRYKARLRTSALQELGSEPPVIMETHGGYGHLFARCYSHVADGVVFEKDPGKTARLAAQRPTWAVYEADCLSALSVGVGGHVPVNFLDLDPYGEPWPIMAAFFKSERPRPARMVLVVNDGLRQKLKMNGGWSVESLRTTVDRLGNVRLYEKYLEICAVLVAEKAAIAGYAVKKWTGYYCGFANQMSHYAAVLERVEPATA